MSHFRATCEGTGTASRLGTKTSRIHAEVQSWQGKVTARLYHDAKSGLDMAVVRLERHDGEGKDALLYHGPVDGSGDAFLTSRHVDMYPAEGATPPVSDMGCPEEGYP